MALAARLFTSDGRISGRSSLFGNKQERRTNMLPLKLKAEHTKQLSFLAEQSSQVLQDFCKLAVDYLQKGPNLKLYGAAANKLHVEPEVIRSSVEALINLLLEASKQGLEREIFQESVVSLGFSDEREELLGKLYEVKRSQISGALAEIGLKLPRYRNMEWRFQVQIASRSLLSQLTPIVTMDITLKRSDDPDEVEHVLLQMDPTNLFHLAQQLEAAVKEGHSQHMRRIKRTIR